MRWKKRASVEYLRFSVRVWWCWGGGGQSRGRGVAGGDRLVQSRVAQLVSAAFLACLAQAGTLYKKRLHSGRSFTDIGQQQGLHFSLLIFLIRKVLPNLIHKSWKKLWIFKYLSIFFTSCANAAMTRPTKGNQECSSDTEHQRTL